LYHRFHERPLPSHVSALIVGKGWQGKTQVLFSEKKE